MKPSDREIQDLVTEIGDAIDGQTTNVIVSALLTCLVSVAADSAASREELTERAHHLARLLTDPDGLRIAWTDVRDDRATTH